MSDWLGAFAFTQLIEVPVYSYALRDLNFSRLKRISIAFGASALTHPIVWFVIPVLLPSSDVAMVAAAETFAVVVEAAYLRVFGLRRLYFSWSLLANALSFGLGLLSRRLIGFP
jgi:hypothetical protein